MINILNTHFLHLLSYLIFYSFFYSSGKSFLFFLTKSFNEYKLPQNILYVRSQIFFPVLGAFFIGNLLIIINFFLPLKSPYVILILFLTLLPSLRTWVKGTFKISIEKVVYYLVIPSLLIVSLYDTGWHYDAGFYHLNHQNWLRESNLIVGMINIHWAFGMSSIYEYISSIFWFDNSFKYLHFLNLMFIHFFYLALLDNINNSKENIIKNSSIFLLLYSLLDNIGLDGGRNGFIYIQGVTKQDTTVAILFLVVSRGIFIYFKDKKYNSVDFSIIFLLTLFVVQIKLSSVPLVILVLFFIFYMIKNKLLTVYNFFQISIPAFLFSGVWLIKQYLNTGCLIYPVNLTCVNNFTWYIEDSTSEYEAITRSSSYSLPYYEFSLFEWSEYFFSFQINRAVVVNFIISFMFILLIFLLTAYKEKLNKTFYIQLVLYILFNFLYLINYGPTPRYTMGTFLLIIASFGFFTKKFKFNVNSTFVYILVVFSVASLVRISSYSSFINAEGYGLFDPRSEAKYFQQNNGYLKPDIGDQCWINLSCTMSTHTIKIDESLFFPTVSRK